MRILVACESSGVVREAFRARGHDAWSCDLLPADDGSKHHVQGDALRVLRDGWDMMICHPPCRFLSSSGLHWNGRVPGRAEQTEEAISFARALWSAPIERIALENPIGRLSKALRRPDQIIQPHQFGADASKATCLWLKGLPTLRLDPRQFVAPRLVPHPKHGKLMRRWANQTDSGQNRLPPSADRWKLRSATYPGVAAAMALAWG